MKEKSVSELKQMMDDHIDFQLIDVREEHEYEIGNINGELIPLGTIVTEVERIDKSKPVIIHCRSGARSAAAINELEKRFGYENLYNLKGGIIAWSKEIDSSVTTS
jgi:rhodanese-related sulfurtransferase